MLFIMFEWLMCNLSKCKKLSFSCISLLPWLQAQVRLSRRHELKNSKICVSANVFTRRLFIRFSFLIINIFFFLPWEPNRILPPYENRNILIRLPSLFRRWEMIGMILMVILIQGWVLSSYEASIRALSPLVLIFIYFTCFTNDLLSPPRLFCVFQSSGTLRSLQ